jgi:hypothetical protein
MSESACESLYFDAMLLAPLSGSTRRQRQPYFYGLNRGGVEGTVIVGFGGDAARMVELTAHWTTQ